MLQIPKETSLDNVKWQMAVDKRDVCLSGWQKFEFEERSVVFVKIVGTKADIVSSFSLKFSYSIFLLFEKYDIIPIKMRNLIFFLEISRKVKLFLNYIC